MPDQAIPSRSPTVPPKMRRHPILVGSKPNVLPPKHVPPKAAFPSLPGIGSDGGSQADSDGGFLKRWMSSGPSGS
jgi:hypothetical protein